MVCSTQDVWSLLTSMQSMMMKQAEDIKNLALQNQELEHKIALQNIQVMHQEKLIHELKEAVNSQLEKTQDALASQDEKLSNMNNGLPKYVQKNVGSWANVVKNGQAKLDNLEVKENMYQNEDEDEYAEQEKRKMNIVIRGVTEKDNEQVLLLNADITDIISTKFGMHDVTVYGAHRVGKKKPDTNRAIVCTLLDARKRSIILENARIYLKDSPLYISEDRTPNQQKARREAYEARTNKKPNVPEENKQLKENGKDVAQAE